MEDDEGEVEEAAAKLSGTVSSGDGSGAKAAEEDGFSTEWRPPRHEGHRRPRSLPRRHCRAPGHVQLGLVGKLDVETADRFAAALQPVLDRGVGTVVLDLSRLAFIDSSGLSS